MTADDMTDRPEATRPFIGRPRQNLMYDHAFQDACADARFAGIRAPEIMRTLQCTEYEQYVAWYIWLGRHPERYREALDLNLGASSIAKLKAHAPACLPILREWRANRGSTKRVIVRTTVRTRQRGVPAELRAAIIAGLERGMKPAEVRAAVRCRREIVTSIARAWRAGRAMPLTDQSTPARHQTAFDVSTLPQIGAALVRQRIDAAGAQYAAMLQSMLTLVDDYTARMLRMVDELCAMRMTRDSINDLARALPKFERYEALGASLAATLRTALDEHTNGQGDTA